jgi:hypothetical protein
VAGAGFAAFCLQLFKPAPVVFKAVKTTCTVCGEELEKSPVCCPHKTSLFVCVEQTAGSKLIAELTATQQKSLHVPQGAQ